MRAGRRRLREFFFPCQNEDQGQWMKKKMMLMIGVRGGIVFGAIILLGRTDNRTWCGQTDECRTTRRLALALLKALSRARERQEQEATLHCPLEPIFCGGVDDFCGSNLAENGPARGGAAPSHVSKRE